MINDVADIIIIIKPFIGERSFMTVIININDDLDTIKVILVVNMKNSEPVVQNK